MRWSGRLWPNGQVGASGDSADASPGVGGSSFTVPSLVPLGSAHQGHFSLPGKHLLCAPIARFEAVLWVPRRRLEAGGVPSAPGR